MVGAKKLVGKQESECRSAAAPEFLVSFFLQIPERRIEQRT